MNRSHGHEVRSEESLASMAESLWSREALSPSTMGIKVYPILTRPTVVSNLQVSDGFHVSCTDDADYLIDRYQVPARRIGIVTQGVPDCFLDKPAAAMDASRLSRITLCGTASIL